MVCVFLHVACCSVVVPLLLRVVIVVVVLVVVVLDAYIHSVYIHIVSHAPQLLATSLQLNTNLETRDSATTWDINQPLPQEKKPAHLMKNVPSFHHEPQIPKTHHKNEASSI